MLLVAGSFYLFVAAKSNFPNTNGCDVGALVFPVCVDGIWLLGQCWKSPDVAVTEIDYYLT